MGSVSISVSKRVSKCMPQCVVTDMEKKARLFFFDNFCANNEIFTLDKFACINTSTVLSLGIMVS